MNPRPAADTPEAAQRNLEHLAARVKDTSSAVAVQHLAAGHAERPPPGTPADLIRRIKMACLYLRPRNPTRLMLEECVLAVTELTLRLRDSETALAYEQGKTRGLQPQLRDEAGRLVPLILPTDVPAPSDGPAPEDGTTVERTPTATNPGEALDAGQRCPATPTGEHWWARRRDGRWCTFCSRIEFGELPSTRQGG
jgi:hypothetical protein